MTKAANPPHRELRRHTDPFAVSFLPRRLSYFSPLVLADRANLLMPAASTSVS